MADLTSLGRYEILSAIGKGAMGVVYKARDPRIDRIVVLKTLRRDIMDTPDAEREFVERFYREARAAGKLSHPSIVTIHDVDRDEKANVDFIAMEYVAGASLQELMASGGRLSMPQTVEIALQLADALDYAHARGVVHRDIKPANIILREDGVAKVTDFGVARLETSELTRTGEYIGTPNYMSPEQVIGGSIDGRADQFSLAIVLYQLLTGVRPFSGDNLTSITYKIVHEDPVPPLALSKEVPPAVSTALMRAMSKDREKRFRSCRDFALSVQAGMGATVVEDLTRSEALREADLGEYPQTIVRQRSRPAEPPEPAVSLPPETGGDRSGSTLSLLHEVRRLEDPAALARRASAETIPAAREEDSVFEVDDSAETRAHERTPLPVVRSFVEVPIDERTREAAADDERTRLEPAAALPVEDEATRLEGSAGPVLAPSGTAAPTTQTLTPRPARAPNTALVVGLLFVGFVMIVGGFGLLLYLFGGRQVLFGPRAGATQATPQALPPETPIPSEPPAPADPKILAQGHFQAGLLAYNEGRLADAERELAEAVTLDPAHQGANDYLQLVLAAQTQAHAPVGETPTETTTPASEPTPVTVSETPAAASTATEPSEPVARTSEESSRVKGGSAKSSGKASGSEASEPKPSTPVALAKLAIHFEHNLKEGTLSLSVDGSATFSTSFKADPKKLIGIKLPRRIIDTKEDYEVEVPAGEHEVEITVEAPDDDVKVSGTRSYSLEEGESCTLNVGVGTVDRRIELSKKCK